MTLCSDMQRLDESADLTRRRLLGSGAAIGAALLAGCADAAGDAAGRPTPTSSAGPRKVSDVFGGVQVPADPRRIVCLDDQTLGNLLALGVGVDRIAGWARGETPLERYPYLSAFPGLDTITNVGGTFDSPNIEAILAARPDLLLMVAEDGADFYVPIVDKLRGTGVPFFGAYNGYLRFEDYLRLLTDVAIAVNRLDAGAELAAGLRRRVADVGSRLDARGERPSALFVRVPDFDPGKVALATMPLLDVLGLPGDRPPPEEFFRELSSEQIETLTADVLFVSDGGDESAIRAAMDANPLWASLPAVKAGRVHVVNEVLWGTAYSLPAVEAMLTDIERALLA